MLLIMQSQAKEKHHQFKTEYIIQEYSAQASHFRYTRRADLLNAIYIFCKALLC